MEHLLIETKDLSIQFKNFVANNKINIRIYSGRIHAIAGENGAGKTTLMRLICGVLQPTGGSIYCDDIEIDSMGAEYRRLLGLSLIHI